jgi:hypothetical protein
MTEGGWKSGLSRDNALGATGIFLSSEWSGSHESAICTK